MNLTPNLPPAPDSQNYSKKRSKLFYLGLSGIIAGGIFCLVSVVVLILAYTMYRKTAPAATALPANNPAAINPPATSTSLPVSTLAPTTQSAGGSATAFNDDFSNSNSGWTVVSTDTSEASYNPLGTYEMGVKLANSYFISLSPDNLPRPLKNILVNVRAQPAVGDTGKYGVVCRFQDIENFYLAGISGNQFFIGKLVKGKWTFLTSPEWQTLPDSTSDAQGYLSIAMSCIDAFIVLEVNGVGAAHVTDDELSDGQAGLCVWAGDTAGRGSYYARAAFDDFSVSLP